MQLIPGIEAGKKLGWVWNIMLLPEIKNAFKNVKGSAERTNEPNKRVLGPSFDHQGIN